MTRYSYSTIVPILAQDRVPSRHERRPACRAGQLDRFLERHLEASASRRGENDPTVVAAYQAVADAFDLYDDALLEAYGEVTPLEIYSGDG